MDSYQLLSFAISAVLLPQICSLPSHGGFAPAYPGFEGVGHERKPVTLTCAINFTDHYKKDAGIVNAIAVTIKEKLSLSGGIKSSLLSYAGYGSPTGSGLTAVIDLYSAIGGSVSVAFTERARPEKECFPNDFGPFLAPKSYIDGTGGYGMGTVGYGIGNYGGYGGFGGYGIGTGSYGIGSGGYGIGNGGYGIGSGGYGAGNYGGYSGYGMGVGLNGMGGMYGGGGFGDGGSGGGGSGIGEDDYSDNAPGIVAKVHLSPGTSSSINVDNLVGFIHLKELAGRGVVVCPRKAVRAGDHGAQCEGGILSCCALHYDQEDQSLDGKYDRY